MNNCTRRLVRPGGGHSYSESRPPTRTCTPTPSARGAAAAAAAASRAVTPPRRPPTRAGALPADLSAVLAASDAPLLAEAFAVPAPKMVTRAASSRGVGRRAAAAPPALTGPGGKPQTLGAQFRASLRALSATMMQTHQHFVRCLKPNQQKSPATLDGHFVCRQLRYLGVPAVVEINRVGYPIKHATPPRASPPRETRLR